jgi:DNA-binding CsgD family transcriptional regulator
MSALQAPQDAWQLDLTERRNTLAVTLRSLTAKLSADSPHREELQVTKPEPMADAAALADLLREAATVRIAASRRLLRQPLMAARRVNVALDRLQAVTAYPDLVRAAPAELSWAGDFDRVLFSRVQGSSWLPEAWHATCDAQGPPDVAFGEFVQGAEIPLTSGMLEAEVVRRRTSALVSDVDAEPRVFDPIVEIALSQAYVIAPVISGDRVIGLLHADTHASGRHLTEADRVTIRAFADGVGLTMERLSLLERLGSQRAQILEALVSAAHVVEGISSAPVQLTRRTEMTLVPTSTRLGDQPDDGLTSREKEVFSLLLGGATNGQIADRLTVSATTVKSHVKHILRKLRAANRAEAIAQYLRVNGSALVRP